MTALLDSPSYDDGVPADIEATHLVSYWHLPMTPGWPPGSGQVEGILLRLGRLAEAYVAPPELRELRELVRFRSKGRSGRG